MASSKNNVAPKKRSFAFKIYMWLLAMICTLIAAHLTMQYLDLNIYHQLNGQIFEISNRVDFDDEASIPTWVSQFILLAIAAAAFFAAYIQKVKAAKRAWAYIGIVGLLMSIDEVSALHELLLQTVHLLLYSEAKATIHQNAWLILLPVIAVLGVTLALLIIKHIPRKTLVLMILGGGTLVFGAAIIDALTNGDNLNTFAVKGIMVATEESLELIGSSTILYAILDYLESNYGQQIKAAWGRLTR